MQLRRYVARVDEARNLQCYEHMGLGGACEARYIEGYMSTRQGDYEAMHL